MTTHRTIPIDGLNVFVREAGDPKAPAIVLLHGFPTSSYMFRDLIPRLADRFHVIAPDLIGFGHSSAPDVSSFEYTFDNLTRVVATLLERLEVTDYVLYVHDYGGPVGLRLANAAPERVRGLVVQNANAYMEGVSDAVANLFLPLWKERNAQTIGAAKGFLTAEATKMQYTAGARDPGSLDPTTWTLDQALLDRPGMADAHLALFVDYEKNVGLYDTWHAYLREHQPRTLVLWGKNDPFFLVLGAEAFRRDVREAEVVLLDGGHFALEEHADAIAERITHRFAPPAGRELAQAFYTRIATGKLDEALSLLSEDVRWSDPKGFPYGGEFTNRDDVKRLVFAGIEKDWATFAIQPERFIASFDGRDVVVTGRYTGEYRASGRKLDVPFAHVWTTAGGELTTLSTHTDTAELRSAMRA